MGKMKGPRLPECPKRVPEVMAPDGGMVILPWWDITRVPMDSRIFLPTNTGTSRGTTGFASFANREVGAASVDVD
jgi:hypothetical protein